MKVLYHDIPIERENQYLSPKEAESIPKVIIQSVSSATDNKKFYTLIMYDPDANYLHWLVINIPGSQISQGRVIVPYKGPSPPPPATFLHHYEFILYEQQNEIKELEKVNERKINFETLLSQLNLEKSKERERFTFISHFVGGKKRTNKMQRKTKRKRKCKSKRKSSCLFRERSYTNRVH